MTLHGVDGSKVGWVTMRQTHGRVLVTGVARGLTPGFHGFHIHAIGLCEADAPAGPFTTAGGHFTGGLHEPRRPRRRHAVAAGDRDGRAFSSFVTDRFVLADLGTRTGPR